MSCNNYEELKKHEGHKIACVTYKCQTPNGEKIYNVAIECETCNEVILDFDKVLNNIEKLNNKQGKF